MHARQQAPQSRIGGLVPFPPPLSYLHRPPPPPPVAWLSAAAARARSRTASSSRSTSRPTAPAPAPERGPHRLPPRRTRALARPAHTHTPARPLLRRPRDGPAQPRAPTLHPTDPCWTPPSPLPRPPCSALCTPSLCPGNGGGHHSLSLPLPPRRRPRRAQRGGALWLRAATVTSSSRPQQARPASRAPLPFTASNP